ncbi:PIR protein [Plasmodium yoelii]|uniref:PIR protein n=2 Tax=Plasmodium yoelii TaxID=5861 RepID=A0AAE9WPY1_PLAYO|nr:PIR protein [Plasmodium yoelii]WBY54917.1 PIR protein [Plasmodium yoelii yoelii]CDU16194.1 YIR protein [Plasmodium yoelii]VTZ72346.1 PIR protein [Plasmodium yoelii]|eukprot:XP_022811417.1 PIR protein [Plasmodium yoelii]
MDKDVCKMFKNVWKAFPDELYNNKDYQFKDDKPFKKYCNDNCNDNLGKINAVCLYFLNELFGDSSSLTNHNKINTVEYIMLWLSYMLSLIENKDSNVTNLGFFFNIYINGGNYYNSYENILNQKKHFLSMDSNIISNFYKAFKLLCEMYTNFDEDNQTCKEYLEDNNEFISKYENLKKDPNINKDNSYNQLLSILLNDYNNLKNKCNGTSSFSSIASKLFIVLSIFGAIGIFLGISYKYSLFGFRKRFKKQQIREKIKNIKKRMNH